MNNNQKQELLDYYKNLLILQYNKQGGTARATISTIVNEILGALVAKQVEEGFNIDTAFGKQLDMIGKYVGINRYYTNYGNLTDEELRILIKFAILKNNNLSSTQAITDSLYELFGNDVMMLDLKNMTLRYIITSKIDPVVVDILKQENLLPRPMGVGIEILYIDEILGFAGSQLQTFDNGVFFEREAVLQNEKTLTINCSEPGVTIIINNTESRTKKMTAGDGYTWSVSKAGYQTVTGSGTISDNILIDVSVFKVQSTIEDSTILINNVEQKGIFFVSGTTLNYTYSVSHSGGYQTQTGSGSVTETQTITVSLGYILNITAPAGSIVTINGEQTNSKNLPANASYTWSVASAGYSSASGSGTLSQDTTLTVYSVIGTNAFFDFNNSGKTLAYALSGTTISYTASLSGYISYSGTKQITQDTVIDIATLTVTTVNQDTTVTINGSSGKLALFENGVNFAYTIVGKRQQGYQQITRTVTGVTNHTTTVALNI